MGRQDEIVSGEFRRWEMRGRGWKVWPYPVPPEPPFRPFLGFRLPRPDVENYDGRKPGLFASFFDSVEKALNPKPPVIAELEEIEPEPEVLERGALVELQALLPESLDIKGDAIADFLSQLAVCQQPIAFELLSVSGRITTQFVSHPKDAPVLKRQLAGFFPEVAYLAVENALLDAWVETHDETLIVEFGLEHEFFLPLATGRKLDPFLGLIGAMSELQSGELALFQVLFQATEEDWKGSALRMVADAQGKGLFVNRQEWADQAENKFTSPLHAAVVRIATKAVDFDRALEIARGLAFALRIFHHPDGNALIPVHNEGYPLEIHEEDVLLRQSHRSGMLLNTDELMGFVHLPSSAVRSPELLRQNERTKAAPASAAANTKFILGKNSHLGKVVPVGLTPEQRVRHTHVIGLPGSGKSNFIFNLIEQDIRNGEGLAVFDPHGDLIEKILGCIPEYRIDDVVLVDPADEEFSVPFNILSAHSATEKRLIASDLTAVFQRLSTSWGDQMTSVLNNAILAFLESSQGGTLADMRRFLIEPAFRNQFLKTVNDPNVVYYWQKGFPHLSGNKSIGPLLTRLDMLLAPKPISYMVSQMANRLDFSGMMNGGKIFLAKLSQGTMGPENSSLMGSLLMAKFHLAALGRQNLPESARRNFYIYLDEAHNFATPSMVEILTGARKYHVGLILAHQELSQLERIKEIAGAVLGCNTRIAFRVTDSDAKKLSEGFSFFESSDLQNLEVGQAICRVERSDHDFNLFVPFSEPVVSTQSVTTRQAVIQSSRAKYATPRAEVEAALWQALRMDEPTKVQPSPSALGKSAEPKHSEVYVPIGSEKKDADVQMPATAGTSEQTDTDEADSQHKALKKQIGSEAESLDYTATFEESVLNGQGRIDIVLRRGDKAIACEISVTNTVEYEVGNILKCGRAGFQEVAVVCQSRRKLSKIKESFAESAANPTYRVNFYVLEEFLAKLFEWAAEDPAGAIVERGKPRKQKIALDAGSLSEVDRKERESRWLSELRKAMKR